ncbi:calcium-translocating P-type ATPase, PMCA-type [Prevotella pallens]|uniref:calcium-translocating P-type ATPase, PMCA-type n=1 Tax=Prevotella pallens TaxID=60133 RepID=UPI001CABD3FE|nr:calcium-translocating P-type ATPase, PMCA-type [Prevotella pallens]MBF1462612.1 calcium-translocating P-type ATPase, PMCA-type [Prevotella pallens]
MEHKQHYSGLSEQEVKENRAKFGDNVLTPPIQTPIWKKFIEKFNDPLIVILLIAGVFSVGISCYEYFGLNEGTQVFFEPVGIFIAILLATGLAFFFEERANKAFSILNKVDDDELVEVMRNGNTTNVPKREIVVGDIVLLNTGENIPADGELLKAVALSVDESSLTGEPICRKSTKHEEFDSNATFPSNFVLRGTKVMEGHGIFRVTSVGDATENGKVFTAAQIDNSVKTPLTEQLNKLGTLITWASYALGVLILAGRVLMFFNEYSFTWVHFIQYLLDSIMICVTLIVVAVPEGLPMAVTLSLAYSMRRMLQTSNLVRKLHACETMGATTVICTDKTGTLTQNQMRVYALQANRDDVTIDALLKEGIAVNSTASLDLSNPEKPVALGNPTEGALLLWLRDQGYDYQQIRDDIEIVDELPFSTDRKYMATLVRSTLLPNKTILYIKGATDIIKQYCTSLAGNRSWPEIFTQLQTWQSQAMRTLGFAYLELPQTTSVKLAPGVIPKIINGETDIAVNCCFLGIVAISDPVRKEVPAAVKECIDAGISVKIVTGDTPGTAKEIAKQVGLWTSNDTDKNIITGPEFEALTDEELRQRVFDLKIIARAKPMDKKRLVESLQSLNQVVAVTGDGTNDAPALKAAHVGLSMGDGTSVAKEASDITIIDNSFLSIGRAVMWGRSLYQNIQRFILFQLTVNVVACLIVLAGAFMGTHSPLTVTQMLWVNLIMDTFAAMALASLPPSQQVMNNPPRNRNAFIITRNMWTRIIALGGIFFLSLLGFLYILEYSDITQMTDLLHFKLNNHKELTPYELSLFFTMFVMLQFWNMFNARAFATNQSAFHFKECRGFGLIVLMILIGQVLIVELGGQMFNVTPLKLIDWAIIIVASSGVLLLGEIFRWLTVKKKS